MTEDHPSCYKPKCKDCPLRNGCEHYKPEVILGTEAKKALP